MATTGNRNPATEKAQRGKAAGRKSVTDALRQEAERTWAESDVKAARGRQRTEANVKRRGDARDRDAEIKRLREELSKAAQPKSPRPRKSP